MKKNIIINSMIVSAFTISNTFAQTDSLKQSVKPKSSIIAGTGISMPVGIYANTMFGGRNSGFAENGFCVCLEYAKPFPKSTFGYAISLYHNNNNINSNALYSSPSSFRQIRWYLSEDYNVSGSYNLNTIFAGIYRNFSFKRLSIDIKLSSSVSLFTVPSQTILQFFTGPGPTINTYSKTDTSSYSYESSKFISLTFGENITIRDTIIKHFYLFIQQSMIYTKTKTSIAQGEWYVTHGYADRSIYNL